MIILRILYSPYTEYKLSINSWQTLHQAEDAIAFVCVEVLRPSQPNGVMSSAVSLPNHTFTGQA